jgi:haloacetate dehalogenase
MFEGFLAGWIDVGDTRLFVRHGGAGPAVVLLHGHPRTSSTWHRVAPMLVAAGMTVVCPDLRGYGKSDKPPTDDRHEPYSKRTMAADIHGLMTSIGHDVFSVVGHDRGSYVALRLALDQPDAVRRLAVLDSVPIGEALARCDSRFATAWWHWFFYAQPATPERVICADADAWYGGDPFEMGPENHAEFREATRNPETVHAMLEDYRAGLGVDREQDDEDRRAGRVVTCPTLALWSRHDDLESLYGDPLAIWRDWAKDVRGHDIDSGHHMAEEAADELCTALIPFLRGD